VIGDDGHQRKVLNITDGEDEMYKIIQNKGDEYIVNGEHILCLKFTNTKEIKWTESKGYFLQWFNKNKMKIETKKMKPLKSRTKEQCLIEMIKFRNELNEVNKVNEDTIDISVKDYLKLSPNIKKLLFGYKLNKSINWEYKKVFIDPYILGMWLGDGFSNGSGFTSADHELVKYWNEWCDKNELCVSKHNDGTNIHFGVIKKYNTSVTFKKILNKYNLVNNKHVPLDYIINNTDTRLKLLAGFIDTDGSVEQDGKIIRISQSFEHEPILNSIKLIAASLGFQTSMKVKKTSWIYKDIKKTGSALILTISGHGIENIPMILERKKCKHPKNEIVTRSNIKIIPYKKSKFYGFEVNGNKKFILSDFTVVHNCEMTARTVIGPDPTLKMGQLAVPPQIAKNLTIPVPVTRFNYDFLTNLVNEGKVNYVLKDNGQTRINLENALFFKGTRLNHGDIIVRKDKETGKDVEILVTNGKDLIQKGDRLKRNGEWVTDLKYPEKRSYKLNVGDICERALYDGCIILLNRQPTQNRVEKDKNKRFI